VLTNSSTAAFTFVSDQTGSSFVCSLDSGAFIACRSPKRYSRLANGNHTFQVKATNSIGQTDLTPASHTWKVDTLRPDTTITSAPPSLTNNSNPTFEFTANEAGSTFQCKLDTGAFEPCMSPKLYSGLAAGRHTFRARATDAAGNSEKRPAAYKWNIDTAAPQTTIRTNTAAVTSSQSATFSFSATGKRNAFECSLDRNSFSACTSPQTFNGLTFGGHTFQVRGMDVAGNVDSTPAIFSWNIQ
jgi:large repetitive protein